MNLNDLPLLFESKQGVVAIESPITERFKILEFIHELAQKLCLPLYFWNQGYFQLQLFNNNQQPIPTQHQCISGLNWLLQHPDIPGIFVFEGVISPDTKRGKLSGQTEIMLSNLVYDLATNSVPRFLVCTQSYVELPHSLAPLIPILINPLPSPSNIKIFVHKFCNNKSSTINVNTNQYETLVRTCLGLPLGELEMLLKRLSRFTYTLEELIYGVLDYKKSKLKGQGVEFINEPDVPNAADLDLLEEILERAAVLLKPEAQQHNLSFPKGMILWGPPGTIPVCCKQSSWKRAQDIVIPLLPFKIKKKIRLITNTKR